VIFEPVEPVTRHRGGGRDEDGALITATDTTVLAILIAPGAGTEQLARGRDSENIACTVYFPLSADIINSDELTVRGHRYRIVVNDWHRGDFGVLEVVCMRSQG
jgi:hypothetical protein